MEHEEFLSNLNNLLTLKPVEELKNDLFITDVKNGKVQFIKVVESLEGVLTNENVNIREKGIHFLSWVLSNLPPDLFNEAEINVVVTFYIDSLKGHHNLIPSTVEGLKQIVKMKKINKSEVLNILVNLFQHVNCQTQLQNDRLNIYSVLEYVLQCKLEEIKGMGPDFVYGVLSFVEGEADPNCLLKIFNFLPILINDIGLEHLAEEMFEFLSCYFPIDFNAAAKDSVAVTREDLSRALIICLSSNKAMSEESLSLIFEKLESTFKTSKIDSYKLLQECCKNLTADILNNYLCKLWSTLSKDILPANDNQVCDAGLIALSEVVRVLSANSEVLSTFLDDILTSVNSLVSQIDENMFQSAVKVLIAVSAKSPPATARILRHVEAFCQLQKPKDDSDKKILLSSLLPFVLICSSNEVGNNDDSSYLGLVNFYLNNSTSNDFEVRKLAFIGLLKFLPKMGEDLKQKLYKIVVENVRLTDDIEKSEELLKIWRDLARHNNLNLEKDFLNGILSNTEDANFCRISNACSFIADIPNFTEKIIPVFLNVIQNEKIHEIGFKSLLNSCKFAKENESTSFFQTLHSDYNLVEYLCCWFSENSKNFNNNETIVKYIAEIIALVVRNQTAETQQSIADSVVNKFFTNPVPSNGGGDFVSKDLFEKSQQTVIVVEGVLGSVRPEVTIPGILTIQDKLTNLALNSSEETTRLSSSRLLAALVNKSKEPEDLLIKLSQHVFKILEDGPDSVKHNLVVLFTWVMKGLVLKGGPSTEEWISTWFGLLGRKDVGETAAAEFKTVFENENLFLNLDSHCFVRVLYRQRLFGELPKLLQLFKTSEEYSKGNYLLAILRIVQGVPIHLIQSQISNIILILSHCLKSEKAEILSTSLDILSALLESREEILSDFVQSFVPNLINLSKFEGFMKIRINALKCLYSYGFYPTVILLPIKNEVIRGIEPCLDDKKRLVRKEAVRARCRWFLIGAPGEDILNS